MPVMGQKELRIGAGRAIAAIPDSLAQYGLGTREGNGPRAASTRYETTGDRTGITRLLNDIQAGRASTFAIADATVVARGDLRRSC